MKCEICNYKSSTKSHLEQHMRIHTKAKPYNCSDCGRAFSQKPNLKRHSRLHSGERPFKCTNCGKCFIEKSKLTKHYLVHSGTKNYQCSECGKTFAENRNLTQHMLIHTDQKPHECDVCKRAFRYKSDFKEHVLIHLKTKQYICSLCKNAFKSVRTLKKHTKSKHKNEKTFKLDCVTTYEKAVNSVVEIPYKDHQAHLFFENPKDGDPVHCDLLASNSVLSQSANVVHAKSNSHTQKSQSLILPTSDQLEIFHSSVNPVNQEPVKSVITVPLETNQSVETLTKNYEMNNTVCQLVLSELQFVPTKDQNLFKIKTQSEDLSKAKIISGTDNNTFSDVFSVRHIANSMVNLVAFDNTEPEPNKEDHRSKFQNSSPDIAKNGHHLTDVVDASNALLLLGGHTESGKQIDHNIKVNCSDYQYLSASQKDYKISGDKSENNIQDKQSDDIVSDCSESKQDKPMEYRMRSRNKLNQVQQETRGSREQYQCCLCNSNFMQSGELKKHLNVHVSKCNNYKNIKCEMCYKTFTTKSNLVQHLKSHCGIKEYTCETCGQMFLLNSSLKTHLRVHTNFRPYMCLECDQMFKTKCDLVNHSRVHSGLKPYQCSVCGKTFSLSSSLKRHSLLHSGTKPYTCTICERSFSQKGNMQKHTELHLNVKDK